MSRKSGAVAMKAMKRRTRKRQTEPLQGKPVKIDRFVVTMRWGCGTVYGFWDAGHPRARVAGWIVTAKFVGDCSLTRAQAQSCYKALLKKYEGLRRLRVRPLSALIRRPLSKRQLRAFLEDD